MCTHVHSCCQGGRRDETSDYVFFPFNIFLLPTKKRKQCERKIENSNPHGFELQRPSIKYAKLVLKVINTIIIIWHTICEAVQ